MDLIIFDIYCFKNMKFTLHLRYSTLSGGKTTAITLRLVLGVDATMVFSTFMHANKLTVIICVRKIFQEQSLISMHNSHPKGIQS